MATTLLKKSPKIKKYVKTIKEQDEDVVITLVAKNPQAAKNKVRFQQNTGKYVEIKLIERMIDHLNIESTILHKESEEAKRQFRAEEEGAEKGNVSNQYVLSVQ